VPSHVEYPSKLRTATSIADIEIGGIRTTPALPQVKLTRLHLWRARPASKALPQAAGIVHLHKDPKVCIMIFLPTRSASWMLASMASRNRLVASSVFSVTAFVVIVSKRMSAESTATGG